MLSVKKDSDTRTDGADIGDRPVRSVQIDGVISSSSSTLRSPQAGNSRAKANIAAVTSVAEDRSDIKPEINKRAAGSFKAETRKPGGRKPAPGRLLARVSPIVKLGAAAAVLGFFAVGLAVLQFGPDETADTAGDQPRVARLLTPQALAGLDPSATPTERAAAEELLTAAVETAAPLSAEDAMVAQMTAGTLAALRRGSAATPSAEAAQPAPPAAQAHTALYSLVLRAVGQGQSPAYIDQMVNDAYRSETITVPAALIGVDGRVDTATILALFVGQ
ncbi:hypothetical protein [Phaeobacter gallaeciensis]|uniref:Uncharacterized protein n=1 Tax=Phaeobacter gallaeciensis TaxID=60890 RepID=A0AAC9Z5L7_9RHOB|nr:hypothetical protein [Phaeobacter gallaeciensis]AHD07818.1 hypothetical protein Gal_00008 [Phaeobacter gallaeciensis DSM 26640]ATE91086.1 hypothetical protein PhaeoP11_00008 [Phaeobacter gallaeciensis]ATE95361.1 hypothetical protein PhaeoP73_00008 [Phaeobacter gallaeciensis]ATE99700.1 hypothetical protein PhaeoP75_00008 [Phaeobacter gallaeciensis]ATF04133.1 hypothetical protein PhaeoP63_00008 [Phaeobacter gallaeciensis]